MPRGRIVDAVHNRGFAFLTNGSETSNGIGSDTFVHIRNMPNAAFEAGVWYEYEIQVNARNGKPEAVNVRKLTDT